MMKLHKLTAVLLTAACAQFATAQTVDSSGASNVQASGSISAAPSVTPAVSPGVSTQVGASVDATNSVTGTAAPQSNDPLVQKRIADKEAKDEYKARKQAAEDEKKAAKQELKEKKKEAKQERNEQLRSERAVQ